MACTLQSELIEPMQPMKNKDRRKVKLAELLETGLTKHRAGDLASADLCYQQILGIDSNYADALNLSGIVARQNGDLERSQKLISLAIEQKGTVATYHHNLARTYALRGDLDQAVSSFRRALSLNSRDLDSLQMLAVLRDQMGEHGEAVELFEAAIAVAPDDKEIYFALGELIRKAGDLSAALEWFQRAAELFPDSFASHFNLGNLFFENGKLADAADSYRRALFLQPEDAGVLNCLGRVLHEQGDREAAKRAYASAITLKPDLLDALSNFGALAMEMGDLRTSEILLRRSLQLDPTFINAQSNLGCLLEKQGDSMAAVECFQNVLSADQRHVPTLCNLGLALDNLGDDASARACYQLALAVQADLPLARFNLSLHQLASGNLQVGWKEYEQRWRTREFLGKRKTFSEPQWEGEDLRGKRIFIYAEQGLGDTFQFVRYVPLVAELGADVFLEVQPEVYQLLQDIHPSVTVLSKGQQIPTCFEYHCPLLSLPRVFATKLQTIPACESYFKPTEAKRAKWLDRIDASKLSVGLVWSGNPKHTRDRSRSVSLKSLEALLNIPGATFYSLQKGPAVEQLDGIAPERRPADLSSYLADFTDTAAAIANLDLVIAVDTSVAHLAGALGKPVWILIAHPADWRWLKERTDSPWYPSATLFRQTRAGVWSDVLAQLHAELSLMANLKARGAKVDEALPIAMGVTLEEIQVAV